MPVRMLRNAIAELSELEPLTSIVGSLYGSRVLAYVDLAAARQLFQKAAAALDAIPLPADIRSNLEHRVVQVGIAADPMEAIARYRRLDFEQAHFAIEGGNLFNQLARHGDFALAVDLYEDMSVPIEGVSALAAADADIEIRRRVLHAARARWRSGHRYLLPEGFYRLFAAHFSILPNAEAARWLDEILERLERLPMGNIDARLGDETSISKRREMHLLELVGALRALLPPAGVGFLLDRYPALAEAFASFPAGPHGLPATQRRPVSPDGYSFAPQTSVEHLLEEAHHIYMDDVKSNGAPRPLWPSIQAYNLAMHWAGERFGMHGAIHLKSIPDSAFALRATIEFAAGVIGVQRSDGPNVRIPLRQ